MLSDKLPERTRLHGKKPSLESLLEDPNRYWQQGTGPPLTPDEALFRSHRAPVRYAENDLYDEHRHLPDDVELPDSDLLKAIHTYTADFYDRQFPESGSLSHYAMDETALLAVGILLDEMACQALGKTGDLALLEGEASQSDLDDKGRINGFTYDHLPSVKNPPSSSRFAAHLPQRELGHMRYTHEKQETQE